MKKKLMREEVETAIVVLLTSSELSRVLQSSS